MVLTQQGTKPPFFGGRKTFPYHYGSHATTRTNFNFSYLNSFHTTMVLTQLSKDVKTLMARENVSIPLWFSRN